MLTPHHFLVLVGVLAGEGQLLMEVKVQLLPTMVVLTAITSHPHIRGFPLCSKAMAILQWVPQEEGVVTGEAQMGSMVERGTSEDKEGVVLALHEEGGGVLHPPGIEV